MNRIKTTIISLCLPAILALGLDARGQAAGPEPAGPASPARPPSAAQNLPERPLDTVVAKAAWGDITIAQLLTYYKDYLHPSQALPFAPAVPPEDVPRMPARWLDQLAKTYAIARAAELAVEQIPDEKVQLEYKRAFESWLLSYVLKELRAERIDARLVEPTEQEIAHQYEMRKREFYLPFEFTMRHIFRSAYDKHRAAEGETFEGIAQAISGDAKMAAGILADVDGKPKRWVAPADRSRRLFKPLAPGEALLVPMSPERREIVRAHTQALRDQLLAAAAKGQSIERLFITAAGKPEINEAPALAAEIGPLPSGIEQGRPMEPAIVEAARKTSVGGVSEVVETKHGFYLILVTRKREERTKPLEEARKEIVEAHQKRQLEKLDRDLRVELFTQPGLKIHYDKFAQAPKLADEDVMVEVGDHAFPWKEIREVWNKFIGEGADDDSVRKGLMQNEPVLRALSLVWSRQHGTFDSPEMKSKHDQLRTGVIAATHIKNMLAAERQRAQTLEVVKAYYEERKMKEYRQPALAEYRAIALALGPEWKDKPQAEKMAKLEENRKNLETALGTLKTINDFQALAQKLNAPGATLPGGFPLVSEGMANAEVVPGKLGEKVRALKPGTWSEAFIDGDAALAVAVSQAQASAPRSFTDAQKEIVELLGKRAENDAKPVVEAHWLGQAKYELVLEKDGSK